MIDKIQPLFALNGTAVLWQIGYLILAGIVLNGMPKRHEIVCGGMKKRWYMFTAVLLVVPLILWAGLRGDVADTHAYIAQYRSAPASLPALLTTITAQTKDPGFLVLMTLFKFCGITDPQVFFLIIATFQMLCLVYTFRRYSPDFWTCIFLFVASTDYVSWMFNGMRQFIAVAMIFAAFDLVVRKKYIQYTLVVLLAAQIHGSAIIMLPLTYIMYGPPLNRKTVLTVLGGVTAVLLIDQFLPIMERLLEGTQYSGTMSDEIWTADDGTNPIRVLVYSVPALMALFGRRYIQRSADPVISMCINASMITMALYLVSMVTSGIYVGRIPIYTTLHGYIALPWMIDAIFEESSARLVKLLMISFYLLFFCYQMFVTW